MRLSTSRHKIELKNYIEVHKEKRNEIRNETNMELRIHRMKKLWTLDCSNLGVFPLMKCYLRFGGDFERNLNVFLSFAKCGFSYDD